MGKSDNIVFIKQTPKDKSGTLFVRTIENRIIKKKSLGIKITESEWNNYFNSNPNVKRFRENKKFPQGETYNQKIEKFYEDFNKVGKDLTLFPNDKKSFLHYWEECFKNHSNHGTVIKHRTIKNKLVKYLRTLGKEDLLFKDINPIFLKQFRTYLMTVGDPKLLSENSVNHYLKVVKSIINQSISDEHFNYIKHPFTGIKFSHKKILKNVLTESQLNQILKTEIQDEDLQMVRDMFLFQLFSNGQRVSDLFLLKWKSISNERLKYTMFKNGTEIDIPVNVNMGLVLSRLLNRPDRYKQLYENTTIDFTNHYVRPSPLNFLTRGVTINVLNEIIEKNQIQGDGFTYVKSQNVSGKFKRDEEETYKGYKIKRGDTGLKIVIDKREELLIQINSLFIKSLMGKIGKKTKEEMNDFVFPVLSKTLFSGNKVINQKTISLRQYKNVKHHTIVYNRKLKKIQELCDIETNLSSHVSRHTYTNLLLRMDNVNLYDISQSLGHSSLQITENYLRSGFNVEKIDYLNKKVSGGFEKH